MAIKKIYIVTGPQNSGKTSFLKWLLDEFLWRNYSFENLEFKLHHDIEYYPLQENENDLYGLLYIDSEADDVSKKKIALCCMGDSWQIVKTRFNYTNNKTDAEVFITGARDGLRIPERLRELSENEVQIEIINQRINPVDLIYEIEGRNKRTKK